MAEFDQRNSSAPGSIWEKGNVLKIASVKLGGQGLALRRKEAAKRLLKKDGLKGRYPDLIFYQDSSWPDPRDALECKAEFELAGHPHAGIMWRKTVFCLRNGAQSIWTKEQLQKLAPRFPPLQNRFLTDRVTFVTLEFADVTFLAVSWHAPNLQGRPQFNFSDYQAKIKEFFWLCLCITEYQEKVDHILIGGHFNCDIASIFECQTSEFRYFGISHIKSVPEDDDIFMDGQKNFLLAKGARFNCAVAAAVGVPGIRALDHSVLFAAVELIPLPSLAHIFQSVTLGGNNLRNFTFKLLKDSTNNIYEKSRVVDKLLDRLMVLEQAEHHPTRNSPHRLHVRPLPADQKACRVLAAELASRIQQISSYHQDRLLQLIHSYEQLLHRRIRDQ